MVRAKKDIIARFSTLEICHTRLIDATTHDSRIETTATSRKDYTPSLFGNLKPLLHFAVIARKKAGDNSDKKFDYQSYLQFQGFNIKSEVTGLRHF